MSILTELNLKSSYEDYETTMIHRFTPFYISNADPEGRHLLM